MTDSVLLNSGIGRVVLLNDGTHVLLNTEGIGLKIQHQHATPLIGPRPEQLIHVEFIFLLKSCIITLAKLRICVISPLIRDVKSNLEIKSAILTETIKHFKLKSTILAKELIKIRMESALITKEKLQAALFATPKNSKLKEVLLRKLKDLLDNDDK